MKWAAAAAALAGLAGSTQAHELVWHDEFDGSRIDTTSWNYHDSFRDGAYNGELQNYNHDRTNTFLEDGKLHIRVVQNGTRFSSGRITTQHKHDWLYGRFEVFAKLPRVTALWPAIWFLTSDFPYGPWPKSGEIDVMEYRSCEPERIFATVHTQNFNHIIGTQVGQAIEGIDVRQWHLYWMEWDEDEVRVGLDNVQFFNFTNVFEENDTDSWPFKNTHHLILNVAVGGNFFDACPEPIPALPNITGNDPSENELLVESARVFTRCTDIGEDPFASGKFLKCCGSLVSCTNTWGEDDTQSALCVADDASCAAREIHQGCVAAGQPTEEGGPPCCPGTTVCRLDELRPAYCAADAESCRVSNECTPEGENPDATGESVQCCEGFVNCLSNWNGGTDIVGKCLTQEQCDNSKMCKLLDERIDYDDDECCEGLFECTQGFGRDEITTCQSDRAKCDACSPLFSDPFAVSPPQYCCGPGVRCVNPWSGDPNNWFWLCIEQEICDVWYDTRCVFNLRALGEGEECCPGRYTCELTSGGKTCTMTEEDCQPDQCTSAGSDPYGSGGFLGCCEGTFQCLKYWNPSANPFFICHEGDEAACDAVEEACARVDAAKDERPCCLGSKGCTVEGVDMCIPEDSECENPIEDDVCTAAGSDPYATGSHVPCCDGSTQCEKWWSPESYPFNLCVTGTEEDCAAIPDSCAHDGAAKGELPCCKSFVECDAGAATTCIHETHTCESDGECTPANTTLTEASPECCAGTTACEKYWEEDKPAYTKCHLGDENECNSVQDACIVTNGYRDARPCCVDTFECELTGQGSFCLADESACVIPECLKVGDRASSAAECCGDGIILCSFLNGTSFCPDTDGQCPELEEPSHAISLAPGILALALLCLGFVNRE